MTATRVSVDQVVDRLTAAELAALADVASDLGPALRQARLARRDEAVRAAEAHYPSRRRTAAAAALAQDLARYLAGPWLVERAPDQLPPASPHRRLLRTIALLNGGAALGWRQVLRIWDGARDG